MNAQHILFRTGRFNLTKPKDNFINPCCFGQDLAEWLQQKMIEEGLNVVRLGQEDWGWYLTLRYGRSSYLLGVAPSGDQTFQGGNDGEWRIIVKKDRSIWEMVTDKGRISAGDAVAARIERVLREQNDFRDVKREAATAP